MPITRRRFNQYLVALAGASNIPLAWGQAHALREGIDWRPIVPPAPRQNPEKIEVIEFFSYGCPFCGEFDPLIKAWAATLPDDITFRQQPVSFGRMAWANLARLYFVLDDLGETQRLNPLIFDALGRQGRRLYTERAISNWLELHDVDIAAFQAGFQSEQVTARLQASDALATQYGINAVPMIAVDGRFIVLGQEARGFNDLLTIASGLIDKARR